MKIIISFLIGCLLCCSLQAFAKVTILKDWETIYNGTNEIGLISTNISTCKVQTEEGVYRVFVYQPNYKSAGLAVIKIK